MGRHAEYEYDYSAWYKTIILAFLPMVLLLLSYVMQGRYSDIYTIVSSGSLILTSFVIVTSSFMSYHKARMKKNKQEDTMFMVLFCVICLILVTYILVKISVPSIADNVLNTASIFCVAAAVFMTLAIERILERKKRLLEMQQDSIGEETRASRKNRIRPL